MNNKRRETIKTIIIKLEDIICKTEEVRDEEEQCFENLSEGLKSTMNGINSENAIDCLNDALESLDQAKTLLEDI